MLLEKLCGLPHAISPFGGDERQLRSCCFNFSSAGLELSHALHAVRSPCTAQTLDNQRASGKQTGESELAIAVGCSQGKVRGTCADFQGFGAILHVELTLGEVGFANNNGWGTGHMG